MLFAIFFRNNLAKMIVYLLVMAISKDPVLLLRMKQQAEDVEVETVFLIGGAFIWADEQTALHLWICQQHDLKHRQEVLSVYRVASLSFRDQMPQLVDVRSCICDVLSTNRHCRMMRDCNNKTSAYVCLIKTYSV